MRRIKPKPFLGVAIGLLLCCSSILIFFEGSLLPFKPCLPISYPDGKQLRKPGGEWLVQLTEDPSEKVLSFYDEELAAVRSYISGYELGQWKREDSGDRTYYYCYGRDLNRVTTETGCISVSVTAETTRVETVRYRSEGSNVPCPLHVAPQD